MMWMSRGPDLTPPDAWPRRFEGVPWTPRLGTIAAFVPAGARVADVAADHAALAFVLAATGHARDVVATDLRAAPLDAAATRHVAWRERLGASAPAPIEMRVGPGLEPIAGLGFDTAVIAGVGGAVIVEMLTPAALAAAGVSTLVLQPQRGIARLRRHLRHIGWGIEREALVRHRGRIYPVLAARRGQGAMSEGAADLLVGPLLRRGDDPLLGAWCAALLHHARARQRHLEAALGKARQTDNVAAELTEVEARVAMLEAMAGPDAGVG